jgi:hypothetical protein
MTYMINLIVISCSALKDRIRFFFTSQGISNFSLVVYYSRGGSRKLVRGWRLQSKNGFHSVFEAPEVLSFRFYREKIEKKFYEGVAVAGSSTTESATVLLIIQSQIYHICFSFTSFFVWEDD